MAIPQTQLETWAKQGAGIGSRDTYTTIKNALERTQFASNNYSVFLQGSYGNDTNIYSESDVDVVMLLDAIYHYDTKDLSSHNLALFNNSLSPATFLYEDFKPAVLSVLRSTFGNDVDESSKKAVKIKANGNRRSGDVIIATQYHRYFDSPEGPKYVEGIRFLTRDHREVINYPKRHSENCTLKHQATGGKFKATARIFKNMRRKLVSDGIIDSSTAPSYFIEGLIYSIPNIYFVGNHERTVFNCLKWLESADNSKFVCANEQFYLVWENNPDLWQPAKYTQFLGAVIELWNNW